MQGGCANSHARRLCKFNSCIQSCSLQDLKAIGYTLSWNNRQDSRIMYRLDRILVNNQFINAYPHSIVNYPTPGISDHSPLQVTYDPVVPTGPKPFKYFEMWESHPTFKDIVETTWSTKVIGSPLLCLVKKISATKQALKWWNKKIFGPVQHLLQQSRDELSDLQSRLQANPHDPSLISLEKSTREQHGLNLV
ncbi:hypothetical protein QJS04_geneDACA018517 [Acorus gramineus]|uniref:Endonuclease/exonuclease/phosphatase domain-containing protein n=1 Tax=Acorus gramineus TaxID=55184 RepID=A0AAV9AZM1_ACOGR|nr:hypothetical protein QJS04_geneDACA018517 [Acorus gramineus]